MHRRLILVLLALVALPVPAAATAAVPKPRESLASWAKKWQAAGRAGDCAFLGGVYGFRATDATGCAFYRDRLAGLTVLGTQQFGTGGVIRWSAAGGQNVPRESALYATRKAGPTAWRDTSTVTGTYGYAAVRSVPTTARFVSAFDRAAAAYARILRRRDCSGLYALEIHPYLSTRAQQCKGTFYAPMLTLLDRALKTRPVRLGGNARWSVYGFELGKAYLTIPMLRDPLAQDRIKVLTWYYSR